MESSRILDLAWRSGVLLKAMNYEDTMRVRHVITKQLVVHIRNYAFCRGITG